jgi:hypothetical protein
MVRDPAQPVQQRYKDPRPHAADTPGGMVMSILHSASGDFEDEPSHRQSRGLLPP